MRMVIDARARIPCRRDFIAGWKRGYVASRVGSAPTTAALGSKPDRPSDPLYVYVAFRQVRT
jgi:hypothetical protein